MQAPFGTFESDSAAKRVGSFYMYETFFGLTTKPFELVPNPKFLYHSQSHKKALSYLTYGLQERAGFILLTGEVGSGKTTIIRDIVNSRDADTALSLIFNTRLTAKQIIASINEDFGLDVTGKDKVALVRDLNDFLIGLHARQQRAVVIIDEAQNLSAALLEEIRLLSNLEADNVKLLQIVLVGQPELNKVITRPDLRQLRQRISVHCNLEALSREESEAYVYHRLALAGNREALRWQEGTFDALYAYSGGIPRLINVFCDFVLLAAFVEETRDLTQALVEEVIGDVSWGRQAGPEPAGGDAHSAADPGAEDLYDRLLCLEENLTRLDALEEGEGWLAKRLAVHEEYLKRLHERQEFGNRSLDERLKRLSSQLEGLTALLKGTDPTPAAKVAQREPVKKRRFGFW